MSLSLLTGSVSPLWWAGPNTLVVCEGDSLTAGFAENTTSWPALLAANPGLAVTQASVNNQATGGHEINDLETEAAALDALQGAGTNILIVMIGTNDVRLGDTATVAHAALTAYVADRKAAGWDRVIVAGPTPVDETGVGWTAATEAEMLAYLSAIKATPPPAADEVIHMMDFPELQDSTDNIYFQSDDFHPSDAGLAVMAREIWTLLLGMR